MNGCENCENGSGLQAIVAQLGQRKQQRRWTDICKSLIKAMEEMNPKDRLEYASCISDIIYAIMHSMQGWNKWFQIEFSTAFGPKKPLSDMPEETFKEVFETLRAMAIGITNLDIKVTEEAEKQIEEAQKKAEETAKKKLKKKEKTPYVA